MEVISANYSTNTSAFNILIKKYPNTRKDVNIINHLSGIYLFFNPLYLLENIRNNLINLRRFVFLQDEVEKEDEFYAGEIIWELLKPPR